MAKIIEFYGLPGCGKSTVTSRLIEKLIFEGNTVCSETVIYDNSTVRRVLHFLKALFCPRNYSFNLQVFRVAICVVGIKKSIFILSRYMKLIKLNSQIRCYFRECDYVVLSEGYIQILLSLFDDVELKVENIDRIKKLLPKEGWIPIYILVSVEAASKRIKERKHEGDEWNSMSEFERETRLEKREHNNNIVVKALSSRMLNGIGEIDTIVLEAIEMIGNRA